MKITDEDAAILLDIAIFRITTFELLWKRSFRGKTAATVANWLKRRCASKLIRSRYFDGRRKFYQLTDLALKELRGRGHKLSRSTVSEPGGYAKATRYAALIHCTRADENLVLYRPSEHPEKFPDLAAQIQKTNSNPIRQKYFYADGDVLGYLVLDRGQPNAFGRKIVPHLHQLFGRTRQQGGQTVLDPQMSGLASMRLRLQHGKCRLTIVTVTEARRSELEREIAKCESRLETEVVVYPDVANVLPCRRQSKAADFQREPNSSGT